LWDASTGKEVSSAPARPTAPVHGLAFSPDGKLLAAAAGHVVIRYDTSALVGTPVKIEGEPVKEPKEPIIKQPEVLAETTRLGIINLNSGAIDTKNKALYAGHPLGYVARFDYPSIKLTGVYQLEGRNYALAVDPERKRLYQVKVAKSLLGLDGRRRGDDAELCVYDISDLKPNNTRPTGDPKKVAGAVLKPIGRVALDGDITGMVLSPDGAWLFVIDPKNKKLKQIDTAARKVAKSVDLGDEPLSVALTPDGKSLWVTCGDLLKKGSLRRYDPKELKALGEERQFDFSPGVVAAADNGRVCIGGMRGYGNYITLVLDTTDGFKERFSDTAKSAPVPVLSGDGKQFVLCPHSSAKSNSIPMRTLPVTGDVPKTLPEIKLPGQVGGDPIMSPDGGSVLLLRSGTLVRLKK
jgi:WD40 repeat protein